VLLDSKMTFSKSSMILGFINRVSREFSDPYTYELLYVSLIRPNLEYAVSFWSPHRGIHSARLDQIQKFY
jgi:hypothetical protein